MFGVEILLVGGPISTASGASGWYANALCGRISLDSCLQRSRKILSAQLPTEPGQLQIGCRAGPGSRSAFRRLPNPSAVGSDPLKEWSLG